MNVIILSFVVMLIHNTNSEICKIGGYKGDCCCNCTFRYCIIADGVPTGYVCNNPIEGLGMRHLSGIGGHSICECHQRIFKKI